MMKPIRILLWVVLGVLVLVIASVALFVATFDVNARKDRLVGLVKDATGRTLAIDGGIDLALFPRLGLKTGKVSLSGPGGSGTFLAVDQVAVGVALLPLLSRRLDVDRITLSGLRLDLVRRRDGSTNFDDLAHRGVSPPSAESRGKAGDQAATAAFAMPVIDVSGLDIRDALVSWTDERDGSRLKIGVEELSSGRLAAGAAGRLKLRLRLEGDKPKTDLRLTGESGYRIDPALAGLALDGLAIEWALAPPAAASSLARGTLSGTLAADWVRQTATAQLVASLAEGKLDAKASVAGFDRPRIEFTLTADKLDLGPAGAAVAGQSPGAAPATKAAPSPGPADERVDLRWLEDLTLNGSVRVGSLTAGGVRASEVAATVQARGGRLEIAPLTATLYQGRLNASLAVTAQGNRIAWRQQLPDVALGALIREVAGKDVIDGRANLSIDVATAGPTVGALRRGLNGVASLDVRDGALRGIDLGKVMAVAQAAMGGRKAEAIAGFRDAEKTQFSRLAATFAIRNGIARNDDLALTSPLVRVTGAGEIDIAGGSVNYLLKASVADAAAAAGGSAGGRLRTVVVPVRLAGPFASVSYSVDYPALLVDAAKQEIGRRLEEQIKGGLGDRLKGLFGR